MTNRGRTFAILILQIVEEQRPLLVGHNRERVIRVHSVEAGYELREGVSLLELRQLKGDRERGS